MARKQPTMLKIFLLVSLFALAALTARADVTLLVNSPAVRFSPATWAGDAGRGGAISRVTWNNGAWCTWHWTTTSLHPTATLHLTNQTPGSAISYFLDGALTDNVPVPPDGGIEIGGLSRPGAHTLTVYTRNSRQEARWSGANAYTVTGLTLDDGAKPMAAPPLRPWVLLIGDSITEGIQADNGRDSSLQDYSFLLGQGLRVAGFDYTVSACGYSGWLRPGDAQGDVPAYFPASGEARWNKIDAHTSLLDSRGHLSADGGIGQEPAAILFNYGVNECLSGTDTAALQTSIVHALTALQNAAPRAKLLVLLPPGLADTRVYPHGPGYSDVLKAAVTAYQAAHPRDHRTALLDLGPEAAHALASPAYGGGVHPNAAGHAYLAPTLLPVVLAHLK
jgi:lysophospholipase L1-like esterase